MTSFFISQQLKKHFGDDPDTAFEKIFHLEGEDYRLVKARRTFRFELDGRGYFAKVHRGIGWKEILKDVFQFKLPVLGAGNEYAALELLKEKQINTMSCAAFGKRGWNPARQQSFLVTEELANMVSLEDYVKTEEFSAYRRGLFDELAQSLGAMHAAGINHRDCYICHYLLNPEVLRAGEVKLFVIDLHRAQIRKSVPFRYRVKDVAGILFSSLDLQPSKRELMRFAAIYCISNPEIKKCGRFWRAVSKAACKLYKKEFGKTVTL